MSNGRIIGKNKGFSLNDIEKATIENKYYRKVLYTRKHSQLVLMSLKPGEEIGFEKHNKTEQFFRIESGKGKIVLKINKNTNKTTHIKNGSVFTVFPNTVHNVVNKSKTNRLQLYTIYSPPVHKPNTIHKTKEDAEKEEN